MSPKSSKKKNIELNANEFEKYTWPLIEKYFAQDKGKFIINHIISSYNDFVFKKIDDIIEGFNPIQIYNEYIPEKSVCNNLNIRMIDKLGAKVQSSSWLLKK